MEVNLANNPSVVWPKGVTRKRRAVYAIGAANLDALVALLPENAEYLSGEYNFIARHWRLPGVHAFALGEDGSGFAVSPDFGADPRKIHSFASATYPLWTEAIDVRGVAGNNVAERIGAARPGGPVWRPAQFDESVVFTQIAEAIGYVAPHAVRVGLDTTLLPQRVTTMLAQLLPRVSFVSADTIFEDLRSIKDDDEIEYLRLACDLAETGLLESVHAVATGRTARELDNIYLTSINQRAAKVGRFSRFREAEGSAQIGIGDERPQSVIAETTIKFDMQVDIAGYHSDIGRTVAIEPTIEQTDIAQCSTEALQVMLAAIRPGVTFSEVYKLGQKQMFQQGFLSYSRGHMGHSVGLTQNFEESPFISPNEHRPIVEHMVLSIEVPYYVYGVGAFQFERMLLVTQGGGELLDRLPLALDRAVWDSVSLANEEP